MTDPEELKDAVKAAEDLHAAALIYEDQALLQDAETVKAFLAALRSVNGEDKEPVTGTTNTELLACPFCGGEAKHLANGSISHPDIIVHRVMCGCGVRPFTGWRATEAEAVEAWNTRPAPDNAGTEAVAWRYRIKSPAPGEHKGWITTEDRAFAEGWCVRMGYEVQALGPIAAPVPAEADGLSATLLGALERVIDDLECIAGHGDSTPSGVLTNLARSSAKDARQAIALTRSPQPREAETVDAQVAGAAKPDLHANLISIVGGFESGKIASGEFAETLIRERNRLIFMLDEALTALTPFAEFVEPDPKWLADGDVVTMGSALARKQLTAGDCRRAVGAANLIRSSASGAPT